MDRSSNRGKVLLAIGLLVATAASYGRAATVEELISQGNDPDKQLKPAAALECYLPAYALEPANPDLLVRIARQYRHLMADASGNAEKLRLGRMALDFSRKAATAGPKSSIAQVDPAITYGKMMPLFGSKEKLEASRAIKVAAEKALAIDPHNDTAWYLLGRWHVGMTELTGVKRTIAQVTYGDIPTSTYEAAVECFEKGRQFGPERPMHTVELGITYVKMGRDDDGRQMLKRGLSMPNTDKDDPQIKDRGKEALHSIH